MGQDCRIPGTSGGVLLKKDILLSCPGLVRDRNRNAVP